MSCRATYKVLYVGRNPACAQPADLEGVSVCCTCILAGAGAGTKVSESDKSISVNRQEHAAVLFKSRHTGTVTAAVTAQQCMCCRGFSVRVYRSVYRTTDVAVAHDITRCGSISLTNSLSRANGKAVDFTHACFVGNPPAMRRGFKHPHQLRCQDRPQAYAPARQAYHMLQGA